MPGLLDIAESNKTIPVNGVDVPVYGVSAKGIAFLLQRFPVIRELFSGQTPELSTEQIFTLVPDAIAAIIAAGTGNPGNPEAEKIAERLPAQTQAEFIEAILTLTMPGGVGPFVATVYALAGYMDVESIKAPDTKSPKPSNP